MWEDLGDNLLMKFFLISIVLISFIIVILIFKDSSCGDETSYDKCSTTKPYFCLKGKLVEKASICGCPNDFSKDGERCLSKYYVGGKNISLNYLLNKKDEKINFVVYEGFYNYSLDLPRLVSKKSGENFSLLNFKLGVLNNSNLREMLLPLVVEIQNIDNDEKEQAEIAISIVQNIPYGFLKENVTLLERAISVKYPYEVIYDMKGICGEKSNLLAFLLKELSYGVAIFRFPEENHEAVGIKCPFYKDFEDSGYCFVETTSPFAINDYRVLQSLGGTATFEVIELANGRMF